jgi:hypothetical protein
MVTVNSVWTLPPPERLQQRTGARRGRSHRSSRRDVELLLHIGNQLDHFHDGHLGNCVEDLVFSNSHELSPNKYGVV